MANRNSEIAKLKADIEDMSSRLMALAADTGEEMEDMLEGSRLRERWERAREASNAARARVQEYAEENPWQMLATGAVVGFILSQVMRRRD